MAQFTRRSLSKAIADTGKLVDDLKIQKSEVVAISIDSWGDTDMHMEPSGFVRLFQELSVHLNELETHIDKSGKMHASFSKRKTSFATMIRPDTAEMNAIKGVPVAVISGPIQSLAIEEQK